MKADLGSNSKYILLLGVLMPHLLRADIVAGERINTAARCKTNCIDQGGVFCKQFGVLDWGYCCYTDMGLPCDRRS